VVQEVKRQVKDRYPVPEVDEKVVEGIATRYSRILEPQGWERKRWRVEDNVAYQMLVRDEDLCYVRAIIHTLKPRESKWSLFLELEPLGGKRVTVYEGGVSSVGCELDESVREGVQGFKLPEELAKPGT
tara:strand:- start:350 stop:736 length:387 start_codon:yes stop_codon:yes gene_type:complete